jgi:flagellar biosynthetic protein FliP
MRKILAAIAFVVAALVCMPSVAHASPLRQVSGEPTTDAPDQTDGIGAAARGPIAPTAPVAPAAPSTDSLPRSGTVTLDIGGALDKPSQSVTVIIAITLLAVAPSLLIMMTSFTRVVIVLSLTRNALGLQSTPPNQVVVGLALFVSLFIMAPTFSQVNDQAIQPYLKGTASASQAYDAGTKPIKSFMLKQTRRAELDMFVKASGKTPATPQDADLSAVIPAFILSEIKTAFIIGFVVFVPFLVIDLIVSSSLMSMGMMMLPPVMVSLPFKILLFVMVDGWALIVHSLITSFH